MTHTVLNNSGFFAENVKPSGMLFTAESFYNIEKLCA
jgi:hypothetical protein